MWDCEAYRGILLSDVSGKKFHKFLRTRLYSNYSKHARSTQCGSVKGRSCAFATQCMRTHLWYARQRKRSAAILFLDVMGAFDAVRRECLFAVAEGDEAVAKIFQGLNLPPEMFDNFKQTLADPTLKVAGTDRHLVELLIECFTCTWLSTEGLPNVAMTQTGTKPGDPLGDILFFLF